MKRFLLAALIIISLTLFLSSLAFAQAAKIVSIKGEVMVQKNASAPWERARIDMLIEKEAQVKTGKDSECTIAFDEELKNIITIKENSHLQIADIKPGFVVLPEGRVFSIIENISLIEKFEIKTPTAIAGVKGTGLGVGFVPDSGSSIICYEDSLHVQGLDEKGNVTEEKDIANGFGINVDMDGRFSELFEVSSSDMEEWSGYRNEVTNLKEISAEREKSKSAEPSPSIEGAGQAPAAEEGISEENISETSDIHGETAVTAGETSAAGSTGGGGGSASSIGELGQERQTETRDDAYQQARETEESAASSGSSSSGGGGGGRTVVGPPP